VAPARRPSGGATEYDWIDRPEALDALVDEILGARSIAIDTEFHRERSYYPQVGLIQLASAGVEGGSPDRVALIDAVAVDPAPLGRLFATDVTVVIHAASQDLEVLDRVTGTVPRRIFDTQVAAGFVGYHGPSLSALVEGELGVRLPKADRLTDWLRRPLDSSVLRYAAADVAHLPAVAERLRAKLDARGRLAWAEDECDELLQRSSARRNPEEAWWRVKEARQLRGRAVRVGQALAAWRERVAAETDQPVRFVLPDLALVGIAQRPPTTVDELRAVRGLDGRHLRGGQPEAMLAAVRAGLAMSTAELRLPTSRQEIDRELRPVVTVATAWIAQLARDLDVDTSLLATRADIEEFLLDDADARLRHGWRGDVVGDQLSRLVRGEAAVVLNGRGRLTLEERSRRPLA
jgi:ribonuclease D